MTQTTNGFQATPTLGRKRPVRIKAQTEWKVARRTPDRRRPPPPAFLLEWDFDAASGGGPTDPLQHADRGRLPFKVGDPPPPGGGEWVSGSGRTPRPDPQACLSPAKGRKYFF